MVILHVIATILIALIIIVSWFDTVEMCATWRGYAVQALITLALVFVIALSWIR